jgi:hypothetical protein
MTRKDYEVIASVFADQMDAYTSKYCRMVIRETADKMSLALLAASQYDINGNKSFKPEKFLAACGVEA